jgi:hypothetical protein
VPAVDGARADAGRANEAGARGPVAAGEVVDVFGMAHGWLGWTGKEECQE